MEVQVHGEPCEFVRNLRLRLTGALLEFGKRVFVNALLNVVRPRAIFEPHVAQDRVLVGSKLNVRRDRIHQLLAGARRRAEKSGVE